MATAVDSHHHNVSVPSSSVNRTTMIFSVPNRVGTLSDVLTVFRDQSINLSRIESRPSMAKNDFYDFFVDIEGTLEPHQNETVNGALKDLGVILKGDSILAQPHKKETESEMIPQTNFSYFSVPWFPRKLKDLDLICSKVLEYGQELDADHPGFKDIEYRKRRVLITENALKFRHGDKLPHVEYTKEERETWGVVYRKIMALLPQHVCRAYNYVLPLLEQNCGFGPDDVPQLEDISNFLQGEVLQIECTGWRLKPVSGLLSSRDFLNGLAFRVFHSTQYIRHPSQPLYTPEPDCIHDILGHCPLFADPDFADFSHEIGLASLGASDEDIEKLSTVYWFTVEFGVCREGTTVKAFGAGLISSFGELEYAMGLDKEKPKLLPFVPEVAATTKYPITTYQPTYFVAESFQDAKEKVIEFAARMNRPFSVRYNPWTQSVEVLDNKQKMSRFIKDIQTQMATLNAAMEKFIV
ncbi:phenylalanine-4-hydroxylase [Planoprotostelium fungivorum]|uniref:phenylalanine 4-monooxygenase n=1 Tax=Planoprotostelium fungivorum TaxID=1890364 RepID=A0A2P6NC36_9EUKA|nr:phenylalanine-4-hydroxylase [Planoprotostelium fungivorum]